MTTTRCAICTICLTLASTVFAISAAQAGPALADAQARYRQDMAVCDSGKSHQHINTCRTEARNALAEARRGGLSAAPDDQYSRNAVRRCGRFQGEERTACETRVFNPSRVDGSVAGGGLLRESVIVFPVQ